MYQAEMFTNSTRGFIFAGEGCYARVHVTPCGGWVFKRASMRELTLNWLEWCFAMQRAGRHMRGMPVIESLAHTTRGYVVSMECYIPNRSAPEPNCDIMDLDYIQELAAAYLAYCQETFRVVSNAYLVEDCDGTMRDITGINDLWRDLHNGNRMWDSRTSSWIVTDPGAAAYMLPAEPAPLMLQ